MPYSQTHEEEFILDYFSDTPIGKFIDIGAYHVETFSNTRALYLLGWSGILVEPSPVQFNAIYEHYKNEPRITTLNVAVGDYNGELDFYEVKGDAVSTSDEAHMKKWANAGVVFDKIKVPQIKTKDFFDEYCHGVDFLSIDTEATNMAVFNAIPDYVFEQIKLFCIEHDYKHEEIKERLRDFGFYQLYFNGENIILGK
jgi:FkbM family methyltransferase